MGFDLQTLPAPSGFADLGASVEIRELPYGRVRELMKGNGALTGHECLFAESLFIDGLALGVEGLRDRLPGRYFRHVPPYLQHLDRFYGLGMIEQPDEVPATGEQASEQPAAEAAAGNV
jgi:hypothetical protein